MGREALQAAEKAFSNVWPPKVPSLNPRTREHVTFRGKRGFAGGIQLRLLGWEVIVDYLGGPAVSTRGLVRGVGQSQRRPWDCSAEDTGGPHTKEFSGLF